MISDHAMALLQAHREGRITLNRRAGSFVGECVVDPKPLTERQAKWFRALVVQAGLPLIEELEEVRHG